MEWHVTEGGIIAPVSLFSPEESFLCGQSFRFLPEKDGFLGTVGHRRVHISVSDGLLHIRGAAIADAPFWEQYLALDEDYAAFQNRLARNPILRQAVAFAPGIRVLRQPFFETLITFIISQNNNIPRIRGIVERLCALAGEECGGFYSFPTPERLAALKEEDLAPLRAGWRSAYLLDAARLVALGRVDERELMSLPTDLARERLMEIKGVGPKVADCVLLFACHRLEVCPMDVWMKRAMALYFPRGFPAYLRPIAGVAQQYLFHWARSRSIG